MISFEHAPLFDIFKCLFGALYRLIAQWFATDRQIRKAPSFRVLCVGAMENIILHYRHHVPMQCIKITENGRSQIDVDVAIEKSFKLSINSVRTVTFLASPQELDALATGFLLCEGWVASPDEITSIEVMDDAIVCETRRDVHGRRKDTDIIPVSSTICFERKVIFGAIEELTERGMSWRRTGGTHSTIVCSPAGEVLTFAEDVSRACSVDKAVGKAALCGIDPANYMLATTGRLSVMMVAKAARAGFPLIASKAAPMSEGIRLANEVGITLVAFARKPNLAVYAGAERVV